MRQPPSRASAATRDVAAQTRQVRQPRGRTSAATRDVAAQTRQVRQFYGRASACEQHGRGRSGFDLLG